MCLEKLLEINSKGSLVENNGLTLIGKGVHLTDISKEVDITIADRDRSGHFGCFGTTRVGKAQPLDALVHAPQGYVQMKDVVTGSLVSTPTGGVANVLAVFPQGVMPIYRITFVDGRSAEACGEHLWEIHHKHWTPKYKPGVSRAGCAKPRILTTLELKEQIGHNGGSFHVSLTKPLERPKQALPLHPYVLGCILGDCLIGKGNRLQFCNSSPEVVERIRGFLPDDVVLEETGPRDIDYTFKIADGYQKHGRRKGGSYIIHPLKTILSELKLSEKRSHEKHIPRQYLESSIKDRIELLRGLLDTDDGTVTKTGTLQFDSSSDHLAYGVQELVWSLGGIAKIRWKKSFYADKNGKRVECKGSYHITIQHPDTSTLVTRPERKKRLPVEYNRRTHLKLAVKSIEFSRYAEAQCIALDSEEQLYVTNQYVVTHNTRIIENIVEQDIRKGYNVAVIDPKGDANLFSKIIQVAAESGRLEEVMLLTPIFPKYSIMLDPLAYYYMEEELVDHIVSGIKAKEDYFIAIAHEVAQAVVAGLALQARCRDEGPMNINFLDIKNRSDWYNLKKFKETIEVLPGSEDLLMSIDQILNSPPDFFAKVSSSLRTTLSALTSGSTGQIIGKSLVNEFIRRFQDGTGVILVCNTGSMLSRRTAHIVGRVLVSMIQSMMGRFYASGKKLNPPLCVHVDEGHNILYKGIQELFNKGGGAGVWLHLYTQSIAQIEEEIGPEATRSIVDNINSWVYMLVNHPDTAKYVEESSPAKRKYQPILSFGGGISVREIEDKRILAAQVLQLPKRYFYLRSYGKLYKGRTADVSPGYVTVSLPDLAGATPI